MWVSLGVSDGSFTYSINNLSKINIYYLFIVPKPPQNLIFSSFKSLGTTILSFLPSLAMSLVF